MSKGKKKQMLGIQEQLRVNTFCDMAPCITVTTKACHYTNTMPDIPDTSVQLLSKDSRCI
jgi:hypothetical protein